MTVQLSGAFSIEVELDRFAELVASKVVLLLREQGSADPDRDPGPYPPAGHRRGVDPPEVGDVTGEVGR